MSAKPEAAIPAAEMVPCPDAETRRLPSGTTEGFVHPLDVIRTSPVLAPLWQRLAEEGRLLEENDARCRAEREAREARKAAREAKRLAMNAQQSG